MMIGNLNIHKSGEVCRKKYNSYNKLRNVKQIVTETYRYIYIYIYI